MNLNFYLKTLERKNKAKSIRKKKIIKTTAEIIKLKTNKQK